MQISQIALRKGIYEIDAKMRNRINTCFMLGVFFGQLTGTAVGNKMFVLKGWRGSGGVSVGFVGLGLVFCLLKGPWERGWVGWSGGWWSKTKGGGGIKTGDQEIGKSEEVETGEDGTKSDGEVGKVGEERKRVVQVGERTIDEKVKDENGEIIEELRCRSSEKRQ